ncbi:hypothetical protein MRB53_038109 [Persea americana]|nr:hypothetical protein MRB53_038109 [Persea americana]
MCRCQSWAASKRQPRSANGSVTIAESPSLLLHSRHMPCWVTGKSAYKQAARRYLSKPLNPGLLASTITKVATLHGALREQGDKRRSMHIDNKSALTGFLPTAQRPGIPHRETQNLPLESPAIISDSANPLDRVFLRSHSS